MSAAAHSRPGPTRVLNGLLATTFLVTLGGCAALGGNVKGRFFCAAPDGICAPTSTIDDRALALITGETSRASPSPAGPYQDIAPRARMRRIAVAAPASDNRTEAGAGAGRTQERVLRIIFQPYIDERGRLHEASAVHAVVQRGEWQSEAIAAATPIPHAKAAAGQPSETSLAEAVDRADSSAGLAGIDPDLPDAAVVAAARARKADPVGTIKADVGAKLAARPPRRVLPPQVDAAPENVPADAVALESVPPAAHALSVNATHPAGQAHADPKVAAGSPPKTRDGGEAIARVKADPRYRAAVEGGQREAKQAAAGASVPNPKPALQATVRAAGLPGAIAEDQ